MHYVAEKRLVESFSREFDRRLSQLEEAVNKFRDAHKQGLIGTETKVRHKGSQLLYTVHEVSPSELILRTPEGKLFAVSAQEFEEEYEL
jgi:hypothetical protein